MPSSVNNYVFILVIHYKMQLMCSTHTVLNFYFHVFILAEILAIRGVAAIQDNGREVSAGSAEGSGSTVPVLGPLCCFPCSASGPLKKNKNAHNKKSWDRDVPLGSLWRLWINQEEKKVYVTCFSASLLLLSLFFFILLCPRFFMGNFHGGVRSLVTGFAESPLVSLPGSEISSAFGCLGPCCGVERDVSHRLSWKQLTSLYFTVLFFTAKQAY